MSARGACGDHQCRAAVGCCAGGTPFTAPAEQHLGYWWPAATAGAKRGPSPDDRRASSDVPPSAGQRSTLRTSGAPARYPVLSMHRRCEQHKEPGAMPWAAHPARAPRSALISTRSPAGCPRPGLFRMGAPPRVGCSRLATEPSTTVPIDRGRTGNEERRSQGGAQRWPGPARLACRAQRGARSLGLRLGGERHRLIRLMAAGAAVLAVGRRQGQRPAELHFRQEE
jgi:hypothetical protein